MSTPRAGTPAPASPAPAAAPPRRGRLGLVALILVLVALIAPPVAWLVVAIAGGAGASSGDEAVYVGVIGGGIVFLGLWALTAPFALTGVVLGIVALVRREPRRQHGVLAIVFGAPASLGLLWLGPVLAEIVPGL